MRCWCEYEGKGGPKTECEVCMLRRRVKEMGKERDQMRTRILALEEAIRELPRD